jgi:hypothetical protein
LQESLVLSMDWVGHYSCLHKWPRKMEDFEDKQSCAEDWPDHGIDPLVCKGRSFLPFAHLSKYSLPPNQSLFTKDLHRGKFIESLIKSIFFSHLDARTLNHHKQHFRPAIWLLAPNI